MPIDSATRARCRRLVVHSDIINGSSSARCCCPPNYHRSKVRCCCWSCCGGIPQAARALPTKLRFRATLNVELKTTWKAASTKEIKLVVTEVPNRKRLEVCSLAPCQPPASRHDQCLLPDSTAQQLERLAIAAQVKMHAHREKLRH